MGVIKLRDAATDPGEWVQWQDDIKLRLRRQIPEGVELSFRRQTLGAKISVTLTDDGRRIDTDVELQRKFNLARCAWAWTDAAGLDVEACDEATARALTVEMGEAVKVGDVVTLTAAKLTDSAKRELLVRMPALETFVLTWLADEKKKATEEEAGKGPSS